MAAPWWHERDAEERAIGNLPWVHGVLNEIHVNLPYGKTETIHDEIEQARGDAQSAVPGTSQLASATVRWS